MIIYILDIAGTFTFAMSGALLAANKRFDPFGVLFIGFVTAVGGGTTRDIILGLTPVFWVEDINYLLSIILAVGIVFVFTSKVLQYKKLLLFFDAIGIGVFTLIGIKRSIDIDILPVFAILMGVTTSVMGGVLRDVFCNEVPLIFQKEIYATACLVGGIAFFISTHLEMNQNVTYFITMMTVIIIRLTSLKFGFSLPSIYRGKEDI